MGKDTEDKDTELVELETGEVIPTAEEVYATPVRKVIDRYMQQLKPWGERGKLGACLLLAQRSQHKLATALSHEIVDPNYARLLSSRNDYAIQRLIDFCIEHQNRLALSIKYFKYGVRITLRREAMIRFRQVNAEWTGDENNLKPICEYCDRMVHHAGVKPT